jgi:hypothetical protein
VPALGADQRRDLARGEDPLGVGCGQRQFQPVRIAADHAEDEVDLLQRGGHGRIPGQRHRHVHRPELRPDPALRQAGQVGVGETDGAGQIRCAEILAARLAQLPGEVVVAVHERAAAKQRPGGVEAAGHRPSLRSGPPPHSAGSRGR